MLIKIFLNFLKFSKHNTFSTSAFLINIFLYKNLGHDFDIYVMRQHFI